MENKKEKIIVVVSYNELPFFIKEKDGFCYYRGIKILALDKIFNPKGIASVKLSDPQFQLILHYVNLGHDLDIFLFAGKENSGSLRMIDLFLEYFKGKIYFVLCHHSLTKKMTMLIRADVPLSNIIIFKDHAPTVNKRCNESPILRGLVYEKIDQMIFN